ncbi:hypothetical protein C8J57DRAFT_1536863 [Mycena rebaudengoi]|nr:hypothetical protein C8J57DRAFT_1536863 [Mycena rebaudengoi]
MTTPVINWGAPGVFISPPNTRYPLPTTPTPWESLEFHPLGAFELCRHLTAHTDEPGRFNQFKSKFLASDIAFLAAGASDDGLHSVRTTEFFRELDEIRAVLPVGPPGQASRKSWEEEIRKLLWDLATKWDRSFGGTTMIIHVGGTVAPGTPVVPERLKADVYLPPHFLAEHSALHHDIAFIVQRYLKSVGVATVAAWTQSPPLPTALVPAPTTVCSAHYVFRGCLTGNITPVGSQPVMPTVTAVYDIDEITRIDELEQDNAELRQTLAEYEEHESKYLHIIEDTSTREKRLMREIDRLKAEVSQLRASIPATPSVAPTSGSSPIKPCLGTPVCAGTPARTTVRPPPYLASMAGSSSLKLPMRAPCVQGSAIGPIMEEYLAGHNLGAYAVSVDLIVHGYSVVRWSQEVEGLGISSELQEGLLDAMDQDRATV